MKIKQIATLPFRWLRAHYWKVFIVILATFSAYVVYVDALVMQRFEGNKWPVPAQIFARPMVLQLKQEIGMNEVIDELTLLGYRRVEVAKSTGEYQVSGNQLNIKRRSFHYPKAFEPERNIRIIWKGSRISNIEYLLGTDTNPTAKSLAQIKLEPWLVARMVNGLDEDRMLVGDNDIPAFLQQALVIVEDRDFYQHHGIAPTSIIRAFIANILAGRTVQGGQHNYPTARKEPFLNARTFLH